VKTVKSAVGPTRSALFIHANMPAKRKKLTAKKATGKKTNPVSLL